MTAHTHSKHFTEKTGLAMAPTVHTQGNKLTYKRDYGSRSRHLLCMKRVPVPRVTLSTPCISVWEGAVLKNIHLTNQN